MTTKLKNIDTNEVIRFGPVSEYVHLRGTAWRVGRKTETDACGKYIVCSCVDDALRGNILTGETRFMHENTEVEL